MHHEKLINSLNHGWTFFLIATSLNGIRLLFERLKMIVFHISPLISASLLFTLAVIVSHFSFAIYIVNDSFWFNKTCTSRRASAPKQMIMKWFTRCFAERKSQSKEARQERSEIILLLSTRFSSPTSFRIGQNLEDIFLSLRNQRTGSFSSRAPPAHNEFWPCSRSFGYSILLLN